MEVNGELYSNRSSHAFVSTHITKGEEEELLGSEILKSRQCLFAPKLIHVHLIRHESFADSAIVCDILSKRPLAVDLGRRRNC